MTHPLRLLIVTCLASACFTPSSIHAEAKEVKKEFKRPKIAQSDPYHNTHILAIRGEHTIIPKGGALLIPDTLKEHIIEKPAGSFILWPTFYRKNFNWLHTFEVTLDQAKGLKPIEPAKLEALKRLNKIIVAVYRNNPISVLPPKTIESQKP